MCIRKSSLTMDVVIGWMWSYSLYVCVLLEHCAMIHFFIDDCIKMSTPTSTENENEKQENSSLTPVTNVNTDMA